MSQREVPIVGREEAPRERSDDVVRLEGLRKTFGGLTAVDGVDMQFTRGRITALIGPNGAGKTTIFNLITGIIAPDAGRIFLGGEDITGVPPYRIVRRGMARSFQDVRVFRQLSVLQNVAMAIPDQAGENVLKLALRPIHARKVERRTLAAAREVLDFVGIENRAGDIVTDLSFGEQKLVAIARLLATRCDVLLLDEPTSGVDPGAVETVIDVVKGLRSVGKTICLVEHSVHLVQRLADHAYFLDRGRVIAQGTMDDLTSQEELVEIYFGV